MAIIKNLKENKNSLIGRLIRQSHWIKNLINGYRPKEEDPGSNLWKTY